MINKYFNGIVPNYIGIKNEVDLEIENISKETIKNFEDLIDKFEIASAIQEIWNYISRTNKYIDETAPWILAKNDDDLDKLKSCIYHLVANLREIAILIRPFMEETSDEILKQLGINNDISWESLKDYKNLTNLKVIDKGNPIFMRLNADDEIEYIKNLMKK